MTRQPTPFVVLATRRTGSSWVAEMLDSHPSVEASPPGLFDRRQEHPFFFAAYARAHSAHGPLARARACFAYLNEIYVPGSELDAVGFKLMYGQARRNAAVVAYLLARRVRIVHLVRSNLLDVVVSRETADIRGRFHWSELYPSPAPDGSPIAVYLDPSTIAARLGAIDGQVHTVRRLLRLARAPSIEVAYENLAADRDGFRGILRFLGVEDANRAPREQRGKAREPSNEPLSAPSLRPGIQAGKRCL